MRKPGGWAGAANTTTQGQQLQGLENDPSMAEVGYGTSPALSPNIQTRCCQYFVPCSETSAPACSTCPMSQLDSCVCHVPASDNSWGNQCEPLKTVILRELAHFWNSTVCTCEVSVVINIFFSTNNHLCSWISQLKAYNCIPEKKPKSPKEVGVA